VVVVAVTSVAAATGLFVGTASAARHAPRGHLTAAAQPPGYKEVTGTAKTIGAGKAGTVTVTCPTGTVAVGGGESNPSGSTLVTLSSSYPTGQKWTATVGNGTTSKVKAQAVATCMTKPSGSAVVKATVANGSQSQTEEIATCKGSTVAIGGGQKTTSSLQQATNTSESGNGSNWVVYENNRDLSAHNFTVYAICAKQPSGYAIVQSSPITNPGGIQASGGATCPAGVPLSGGVNSVSTDLYADMNQSEPFGGDGWQATMNNVNSTPTSFTVEVICAT
jgi:hypothetical protein